MSTHSVVTEQITPKQAAAWLDHNYEHNRSLSQSHVKFLAREMELGRFTLATIHFMYVGNEVHLVNGQHTLHAIVLSGKAQTCVVIREHGCNSADLPKVFMHYDIQRRRKFGDTAKAFNLHDKMGVPLSWVDYTAGAIRHGSAGFGIVQGWARTPIAVSDLFDMVPKWATEIKLILSAIEGGNSQVTNAVKKQAVLSIAMITAYYQPDKAKKFWHNVTHSDGLSVGDPCRVLYEYLPKTQARSLGEDPVERDVVSRAVAYCWNAHTEERLLSFVRVRQQDRNLPFVINGTPYSGKQSPTFWPLRNQERIAA